MPVPIAILLAGVGAGIVGIILERLMICHFYNQLLSSLVVTWGLSLMISQGFLLIFGPSVLNVPTHSAGFAVGELSLVSTGSCCSRWPSGWSRSSALFSFTPFGAHARATMENPEMAEALGIETRKNPIRSPSAWAPRSAA